MKLSDCKLVMKQQKLKIGNTVNGKWKAKTKKQMLQEIKGIDTMIGSGAGASTPTEEKNVFIEKKKVKKAAEDLLSRINHPDFSMLSRNAGPKVRNEFRRIVRRENIAAGIPKTNIYLEDESVSYPESKEEHEAMERKTAQRTTR
jgi:hypothetical protein